MAEWSDQAKRGVTPGKLILIGVLAVILVAVLYIQFGGSSSAAPRKSRPSTASRTTGARRALSARAVKPEQGDEVKEEEAPALVDAAAWKEPNLATVIAYDPFALPTRFPQPQVVAKGAAKSGPEGGKPTIDPTARALEESRQRLEEMRQLGVKVILKEDSQYVALVGDQTIRVGDEINGFTVTAITPSGVRVERKINE